MKKKYILFFKLILFIFSVKVYAITANEIESKVTEILSANTKDGMIQDYEVRNSSIKSKLILFKKQVQECQESNTNTNTVCVQGNDKSINQALSTVGSIVDVGGMAMASACGKFASAIKMLQAAQAGARGTCAFQKGDCIDKCSKAEKTAALLKSDLNGLLVTSSQTKADNNSKLSSSTSSGGKICTQEAAEKGTCMPESSGANERAKNNEANGVLSSVTTKTQSAIESIDNFITEEDSPTAIKRVCTNTANEATAKMGMNLSSLMMAMQGNSACKNDMATFDSLPGLQDCTLTGTCTATEVPSECLDPKNKDAIYCKTPTLGADTRGTSGSGISSTKPTTPNFDLDSKNLPSMNMDGLGGMGDGAGSMANIGDTPGPKSAGVPGGGGGGGLSIPGGSATPPRGGGGRGVSSDGSNNPSSPSYAGGGVMPTGSGDKKGEDLQQYLPGGAKDPNLAKVGGPEGITSPSGPTIFEKVSKGYKNTRSTLIPE